MDLAFTPEEQEFREEVRAWVRSNLPDEIAHKVHNALHLTRDDMQRWAKILGQKGWLGYGWPKQFGGPGWTAVQKHLFEEETALAGAPRIVPFGPVMVAPVIMAFGSPEQQQRFLPGIASGEVWWSQGYSEPGAGSDLASLSTKAERVEGGWALTGQKVWTTMAHIADWGICLARTDPNAAKHLGISCFLVDLKTPGIEVRPLRELTGAEMFNEVFFDAVFVPDDLVVGEIDAGWETARTTLANERVSMGSGGSFGPGVEGLLAKAAEDASPVVLDHVGRLLAESHALAALGWRSTLRALTGAEPGPEASVRKLLGVEHEQRIQELGLGLLGPAGAVDEGEGAAWIGGYLGNRCLSIAGGTSEIQRNVIAERLLGLPRDPEPTR